MAGRFLTAPFLAANTKMQVGNHNLSWMHASQTAEIPEADPEMMNKHEKFMNIYSFAGITEPDFQNAGAALLRIWAGIRRDGGGSTKEKQLFTYHIHRGKKYMREK